MNYRPDIDSLRAIAVLTVILNHARDKLFVNGHLGVDVFFVISGFVISASLVNHTNKSFGAMLVAFYTRRMKRLLPALIVCCLVTAIAIAFVDPSPQQYLRTGITAIFGFSNIYLYLSGSDYFSDSAALNPFTHTWSLGVEEQFYLFFPFLFWLIAASGSQSRSKSLLLLFGLIILSVSAWILVLSWSPSAAFYLVVFRSWQLLVGVAVFFMMGSFAYHTRSKRLKHLKSAYFGSSLALVFILLLPLEISVVFGGLAVTTLTAVLLALGANAPALHTFATNRQLVFVGRISYSLYLWHWPVLVIAAWTIGTEGPILLILLLAIMFVLAWLSYIFVERSIRKECILPRPFATLAVGIASMAIASSSMLVLERGWVSGLYLGQLPNLEARGVPSLIEPYKAADGSRWAGTSCVLTSNSDVGKQIEAESCTIGDSDAAETRVLVIGNSFSAALVEAVDASKLQVDRISVTITSSWGASLVPEIKNESPWAEANDYYWQGVVPDLIEQLQPGDTVFMVSDLASLSPLEPDALSMSKLRTVSAGLYEFSDWLSKRGLNLAVLGPLPFARDAGCEPSVAIPQWFAPRGGPCSFYTRETTLQRLAPINALFEDMQNANILRVFNLFDLFCPKDVCTYQGRDGIMLYRDIHSHPSVEAARASQPKFLEFMRLIANETSEREWLSKFPVNAR